MTTAAARVAQLERVVATRPAPPKRAPDPDPVAIILDLFRRGLIHFTGLARVAVNPMHLQHSIWVGTVAGWLNAQLVELPRPVVLLTPAELATGVDLFHRGQLFYTWHQCNGQKTGHRLCPIWSAPNRAECDESARAMDVAIKAWAVQTGTPAPTTLADTAPIVAQWVAGGGILIQ